jgi:hypothetical protein
MNMFAFLVIVALWRELSGFFLLELAGSFFFFVRSLRDTQIVLCYLCWIFYGSFSFSCLHIYRPCFFFFFFL